MDTHQIIGCIAIIFVIYVCALIWAVYSDDKDNNKKKKK